MGKEGRLAKEDVLEEEIRQLKEEALKRKTGSLDAENPPRSELEGVPQDLPLEGTDTPVSPSKRRAASEDADTTLASQQHGSQLNLPNTNAPTLPGRHGQGG